MDSKHVKPKTCGIYAIVNLNTNKRYIGSSVDMRKRCLSHRLNLRKGKHHSIILQRSWDKHGEQAFIFVVIEECTEDQLIRREQLFIDALADYNSSPTAGTTLGLKHSQEDKIRRRDRMRLVMESNPSFVEHITTLSKDRPKSEAWKEKMSKRLKGVKKSESQVEKMAKARAELSEEQVLEIFDMRKSGMSVVAISKQKGIGFGSTQRLLDGKSYRWVEGVPSVEELHALKLGPSRRGSPTPYQFKHNDHGSRHCTRKELIAEFPNVRSGCLSSVCRGEKKTTSGWSVAAQ